MHRMSKLVQYGSAWTCPGLQADFCNVFKKYGNVQTDDNASDQVPPATTECQRMPTAPPPFMGPIPLRLQHVPKLTGFSKPTTASGFQRLDLGVNASAP